MSVRILAAVAQCDPSWHLIQMNEAHAQRLIEAHIKSLNASSEWNLVVVSSREHPHCWAFGLQPFNSEGQSGYDIHCFEVDKATGTVSQYT